MNELVAMRAKYSEQVEENRYLRERNTQLRISVEILSEENVKLQERIAELEQASEVRKEINDEHV